MSISKTVTLLIVSFSCGVNSQIGKIPRLPSAKIYDDGHVEWSGTPRIVGGLPAFAGEFRGKISLQTYSFEHFCGGVLIDNRHVVTAAHCVTYENGAVINPTFYRLIGDDLNLRPVGVSRQTRYASHVFVHPLYNIEYLLNDIAVIRVTQPFAESHTFSPIPRLTSTPAHGYSCGVAGWGALYFNGSVTNTLQRVNVSIIDQYICNGSASYNGEIRAGMICAGNMLGGQDACQGDSGGGLICGNGLAGIVSWGYSCAAPRFPGVYTDVPQFNTWIESVIIWNGGEHANVPTPTTEGPSGVTSIIISFNLIVILSLFVVLTSM